MSRSCACMILSRPSWSVHRIDREPLTESRGSRLRSAFLSIEGIGGLFWIAAAFPSGRSVTSIGQTIQFLQSAGFSLSIAQQADLPQASLNVEMDSHLGHA